MSQNGKADCKEDSLILSKNRLPIGRQVAAESRLIDKFAENKDVATTPTAQSGEGGPSHRPLRAIT
jgi:hypothetical protein